MISEFVVIYVFYLRTSRKRNISSTSFRVCPVRLRLFIFIFFDSCLYLGVYTFKKIPGLHFFFAINNADIRSAESIFTASSRRTDNYVFSHLFL